MKRQKNNLAPILVSLCLISIFSGCANPPASEPAITPDPTLVYELVSKPFQESGQNPPYEIKAEIPFLQDSQQVPVEDFNQQVDTLIRENMETFRNSVLQSAHNPPISSASNYDLKYSSFSSEEEIISLKLDINSYFDGAAHPGEQIITFNYDLDSRRQLKLEQLFKPGSAYLERIAAYCKVQLGLRDIAYTEAGAEPTTDNYRNWNITSDGLLITFDMYQVAAGAAGPQTVVVPYVELKDLIDFQGPLSGIGN